MVKTRQQISELPSHKRKTELRKLRMFKKHEAKRTLPMRIKLAEEAKKKKLEETKR